VVYSIADLSQTGLFFLLGLAVAQLVTEYLLARSLQRDLHRINVDLERRIAEAVTAERQAQQNLRNAQRLTMLGEAAARIAHEIKNPLVSIGGFASRIKKQIHLDHPAHTGLSIIVQEVARLEILLRELLDFAGPGCRERNPVEVAHLVHDVLALAQQPAQTQGVQLVFVSPESRLSVMGDRDQLERALLNIVLNGVQSMPEGGDLTVTATSAFKDGMHAVSIIVEDTGTGIPPENLSRIFDPFFTTKQDGTGLGLPLVKKTVDAHGGAVQVESTPRGGTSVTVWFPIQEADPFNGLGLTA
jgi:signal transduction histidine kinase